MSTENAKISFKCPGCKRTLNAGASVAGKIVKCPCGTKLTAPSGKKPVQKPAPTPKQVIPTQETPPVISNPNLTACQDCNAQISKRAQACPRCGSPTGQGDSMDFGGLPSTQPAPMMASAPLMQAPAHATPQQAAQPGQKFCSSCGALHNANQAICLKCGVAISPSAPGGAIPGTAEAKSKNIAGVLGLLIGGLGLHKFYHGSWGWGILYLVFIMTFIPAIVGMIEGIVYLCMSQQAYDEKYNHTPPSAFKW